MLELFLNKPKQIELKAMAALPALMDDEVKIQLIYGGICGSDLSVFLGKLSHAAYPLRPGHELLGRIIEAGKNVPYETGTRVIIQPNSYCGKCRSCMDGKTNICPEKKSMGVTVNGGFSEQFVISSKYVMPVPDDLPDKKAILVEPFAVIVHAFKKVHIAKGTTVAVIGSGNEGMLAVALANYLGADVTAIDINPIKLELIKSFGGIRAIHPNELNGETFDIVIEAAGAQSAFETGLQLVAPGGQMVLIGLTPEATIPVVRVVRSEITIHGSIIYNVPDDFQQAMVYLRDQNFNIQPVVSKIIPFTDYNSAFEDALSGNYGKIVMDFGKNPV
ncbi:zinc-dependent alcohol dehydrogenase [Paenibacillus cremeus]|uniref:Zinc-binding dehydrogenase n=1 Tax=Paenibacillus cremeus TaxID=2163881 RepID=A0A559KH40_9BACL|nr:alcohol dehydrogenase catalytic domain-containing protein [Paenibacillus cremeus]TVY11398.1 zinc-binding dehydrogenase [Paenibacillus cremeus]